MGKRLIPFKIIFTNFIFILLLHPAIAQEKFSVHAAQVQFEILGPAGLFSLNFDSRFAKKENGTGFRIGLGGAPLGLSGSNSCNSGIQISVPAGLNYLIGNGPHLFEAGAGAVLSIISATKIYCPGFDSGFFSDDTAPYTYLLAGYRYQPVKKKGTTFRIFGSPLFQNDFPVKFWGGISVGHRF
ncbi:MAG TPA: hypothetical protein VI548_12700 [Chitinophagaceae bacterium]|nr:hypothetical protein [Chitinophagaceae bacterium]